MQVDTLKKKTQIIFDSTDENKELLKKHNDVFDGISSKIKAVSNDEYDYEKDYMKVEFNSDLFLKEMVNFICKFF